jgi:hypothetical protein
VRPSLLFIAIAGCRFLLACASMENVVINVAARDFACPADRTVITDVVVHTYRVEGCGSAATYSCQESSGLRTSCSQVEGTQSNAARAQGQR